jgi:hypothetical protein
LGQVLRRVDRDHVVPYRSADQEVAIHDGRRSHPDQPLLAAIDLVIGDVLIFNDQVRDPALAEVSGGAAGVTSLVYSPLWLKTIATLPKLVTLRRLLAASDRLAPPGPSEKSEN